MSHHRATLHCGPVTLPDVAVFLTIAGPPEGWRGELDLPLGLDPRRLPPMGTECRLDMDDDRSYQIRITRLVPLEGGRVKLEFAGGEISPPAPAP